MLRLLVCDYQRTARCYTIYRTFKRWSSDDFATILRLFVGRNYDYRLRLFQPERYDYCWPLLAIGRQPEKRCGESRQWFRAARRAPAAGLPRRVEDARPPALTADPVPDCKPPGVGSIETPPGWHGLRYAAPSGMDPQQAHPAPFCIPYYNRRLCWPVQRPGVAVASGYRLSASGRVYALQRVAGGIIAVCARLVSRAVEWAQSQEKPLQSPVCRFVAWAV